MIDVRAEIRQLAYDMVRLDTEAAEARKRGDWTEVGELVMQREEVQLQRSYLMWDVWQPSRRRRAHAAA